MKNNPLINPLKYTNIKPIDTKKLLVWISFVLVFISGLLASEASAAGASLYLAPSRGTFLVGSTFSIAIFVDTKGNEINAVQVDLKFPSEILQVTAPTAGESFISEWLTPPSYSNMGGVINFKGGVPEGIVTSAGLVSTITFRAKSAGTAKIEFSDSSMILLKDGKGTTIFTTNLGGTYEILVPLPEGPKITSVSHFDPAIWYSDSEPIFSWEKEEGVNGFSYGLSQNPQEIPDTVSEGLETSKSFSGVPDGIWYFHLRSRQNGIWGRTSHFQVKIDAAPPQLFEPKIDLKSNFIYFETEDLHSGIDHYEISISNVNEFPYASPFFVEADSPFKIPSREAGKYIVAVRAFDKAGNLRMAESGFQIISPAVSIIEGKGILLKGLLFSWRMIFLLLLILTAFIGFLVFYFKTRKVGYKKGIKEIEEALEEIKKIEEREKEVQEMKERFKEEKEKLEEKLK